MARCKVCSKFLGLFRSRYTCAICGETLCYDCVVKIDIDSKEKMIALIESTRLHIIDCEWNDDGFYLCPTCNMTYNSRLGQIIRNASSIGKENVRLYSARYQGRLPKHTDEIQMRTFYYRDKNEAEDELKVYAASLGCRDVIDVHYNKKSESDGNYIYSVFQYEGKGIK